MVTATDASYVREVLAVFYPGLPPNNVTDEMAGFAARLHYEALRTSRLLDLVPKPPATPPGPTWLLLAAVQAAWRSRIRGNRLYDAAVKTIAWKFRGEYDVLRQVEW